MVGFMCYLFKVVILQTTASMVTEKIKIAKWSKSKYGLRQQRHPFQIEYKTSPVKQYNQFTSLLEAWNRLPQQVFEPPRNQPSKDKLVSVNVTGVDGAVVQHNVCSLELFKRHVNVFF
eukprot:Platyproteum_vivax@DN13494_c0_g1_i1.p1